MTDQRRLAWQKKHAPQLHAANTDPSPKLLLAANVQDFRRRLKFSQTELSKKAGLGYRTVARIETCEVGDNPSLDTISRLAEFLGVKVRDLFADNEMLDQIKV